MPVVTFSKEDIKSSYQVQEPGWFVYEILKVQVKPAKSDGSDNNIVTFLGKTGEMEGVRVSSLYSSKAAWAFLPLFKAANGGEIAEGKSYDWNDLVGCQVEGFTKRGDRFPNEIVDFRPVKRAA